MFLGSTLTDTFTDVNFQQDTHVSDSHESLLAPATAVAYAIRNP